MDSLVIVRNGFGLFGNYREVMCIWLVLRFILIYKVMMFFCGKLKKCFIIISYLIVLKNWCKVIRMVFYIKFFFLCYFFWVKCFCICFIFSEENYNFWYFWDYFNWLSLMVSVILLVEVMWNIWSGVLIFVFVVLLGCSCLILNLMVKELCMNLVFRRL